jgi:predicted esterase
MKKFSTLLGALCLLFFANLSFGQSIPFPPEPNYNDLAPWGYSQVGTNWNTSPYLPFKYQGIWFRLMPPNGVTFNRNAGPLGTWTFSEPGKLYPLMIFSTGAGERGSDNNAQLKHGGQVHMQAVQSGRFPGFTLWWQTENGYLDSNKIQSIINKLLQDLPIDIDRIYSEGFSRGGTVNWQFVRDLPRTFAATFSMSGASGSFYNIGMVHIPARLSQGGLDTNPEPIDAYNMLDNYNATGGSLELFYYPTLGHGTWNTAYALPDFYEWFLKHKKNQIHVFFGESEVCPGEPVNIKLGMTGGFSSYEWRKDGALIAGATQNDYTATSFGSYTARFRRGSIWTEWSEPVVIQIKAPTQTPPITTVGLKSAHLPSLDGSTSVTLQLPAGYEEYTWKDATSGTILGTQQTLPVSNPGGFVAQIKEVGGCSSLDSPPFSVVNANGPNAPDPISNLVISPQGLTSLVLNWANNPAPANDETGFEIFRSENEAGPYSLVKVNGANVLTHTDAGLLSGKRFYYIIRAINTTGASPASSVVSAVTGLDEVKPTSPLSLTVTAFTPTSVTIRWNASTDNVGVVGYDIYVNGVKAYVSTTLTSQVTFVVNGLLTDQLYNFVVRARDAAENSSEGSNQVSQATISSGLNYKYYHHTAADNWTVLPVDFNALLPVKLGWVTNFSLTPRTQNDYFAFRFEGKLNVTTASTYTFYLNSDDGSKLYIDGVLRVNNDGLHGTGEVAGSPFSLSAGVHDIVVEHFEKTGGEALTVRWSRPGLSVQNIPNSALTNVFTYPAAPSTPTWPTNPVPVVAASYNAMNVRWNAYTGTATTIEVYRSLNNSTWYKVQDVPATQNTFQDTGLNANTRYYYRLRAVGPNRESGYTASRNAFTQQLPPVPAAPSTLTGVPTTSSVTINWLDNSTNETGFDVEQSIGNTNNFQVLATVAAGTTSYVDDELFAHTSYTYRVRARNVTGFSAYSNSLQLSTLNSNPSVEQIAGFQMRYDEDKVVQISAGDVDNDNLIITAANLPDFAYLYDYGDGTAEIFFEPAFEDMAEYTGIQVSVTDGFGGSATSIFNFIVNENHSPTINPISGVTMKETYLLNTSVTAEDLDGDPITWELTNAPDFVSYTTVGNTINFIVAPGEEDAGNYMIKLKALDVQGSFVTADFPITVENFDPHYKVLVNFGGTTPAPAPWNNFIQSTATMGASISGLSTQTGSPTGISLTTQTTWISSGTGGFPTDASYTIDGILYPNSVGNTFYNTLVGSANAEVVRISGLNPNNKYNFSLLSARNTSGTRNTIFEIAGQQILINASYNTSQVAKFIGIIPDTNGDVFLRVYVPVVAGFNSAALNAMVIESYYDGNTAPEAPTNFAVNNTEDGITLTWTDNSAIEAGVEVFRSDDGVNFVKRATTLEDATMYVDDNYAPLFTYYYAVRAVNSNGNSAFTDTLSIEALNRVPYIAPIDPISVSKGSTKTIRIVAEDPEGEFLSFWLENAPAFASLSYVDHTSVDLVLSPLEGDAGSYAFNLVVMDGFGDMSNAPINVTVADVTETLVYLNFTRTTHVAGSPWNNRTIAGTNTVPINFGLSNMTASDNTPTTIDFLVNSSWSGTNTGINTAGVTSGIYETNVVQSAMFINGTNQNITFSGLKTDHTYDLTLFASRNENGATINRNVAYASGGKSSTINVSNNSSNVANLLGLIPNASGEIVLNVSRGSGNTGYIYLGSVIIREYQSNGIPLAPTNLVTSTLSRTSIKLDWSDQSDNEVGFEIWRSVGNNGNYQLLTTTAANVQSFTNTGLTQNSTYYYKVRAKVDNTTFSPYTDESSAKTFVSSVSINFGALATNPAPAPWNNLLNFLGSPNDVVNNLADDLGTNSGMSLRIIDPFIDDNTNGMNTGNNSGIVPDAVMETAYWVDPGSAFANIRIENLSLLYAYNFGFFGSRNGGGNRTTIYTIGTQSVSQNAAYNTSNIVQLKDITPDANGGVTIHIQAAPGASFGYLNGLVIQVVSPSGNGGGNARIAADGKGVTEQIKESPIMANGVTEAYPNPFNDRISLQSAINAEIIRVSVQSATGSIVNDVAMEYSRDGLYEVDLSDKDLVSGMYFMRVFYKDGSSKTLKIIRK